MTCDACSQADKLQQALKHIFDTWLLTQAEMSNDVQRARLKVLQQRQNPRSRVRNYNQQDDIQAQ